MKKFLVLAAFVGLCSVNAFAMGGKSALDSSSWSDIRAQRDLIVSQPGYATPLGEEGVFNACVAGDVFKSIKPVKYCSDYKVIEVTSMDPEFVPYTTTECLAYSTHDVEVSRHQMQGICTKYNPDANGDNGGPFCLENGEVPITLDTTVSLEVIRTGAGDNSIESVGYKSYTIPACAN